MGRDKAALLLDGVSLLDRICATARVTGLPTRVIKRDLAPGNGPLGGIYTALKTSACRSILFMACDMPLVTPQILQRLLDEFRQGTSLFVSTGAGVGFPFILDSATLPSVERQLASGQYSIQSLAKRLRARVFRPPPSWRQNFLNANTPGEWKRVREAWKLTNQ
jgi:molybdenum cofactor guanylyltransferase